MKTVCDHPHNLVLAPTHPEIKSCPNSVTLKTLFIGYMVKISCDKKCHPNVLEKNDDPPPTQ